MEQLVARRAHNPKVVGSSPASATTFYKCKICKCYKVKISRGMEQLVARRAHNPKVVGSSPAPATI